DVSIDDQNTLHLAFVRNENTQAMPAGVYYRKSDTDGASWSSPIELVTSLYFRPMSPDEAFVQVNADGQGVVLAAWEDAELHRSFFSSSTDGGFTFEAPAAVETLDQSPARRTRFMMVGNPAEEYLRLWTAGD